MKPIIGITCDYNYVLLSKKVGATGVAMLSEGYYRAIEECGGIPVIIPIINDENIEVLASSLDGIILSGGGDLDPLYFDEDSIREMGGITPERDRYELAIAKMALDTDIPILGICRGHQVLNVALGGSLYQDIYKQGGEGEVIKHNQSAPRWYGTHDVNIIKGTKLYSIIGKESIRVNSFHHQAVKILGYDLEASGYSRDKIVEAIEGKYHRFALGIQWHPEAMWERNEDAFKIFKALVDEAKGI